MQALIPSIVPFLWFLSYVNGLNMRFNQGVIILFGASFLPHSDAFSFVKNRVVQHPKAASRVLVFSSKDPDYYDDWYADFDPSDFAAPTATNGSRRRPHGYIRDTSADNSNVNLDAVNALLQERADARSERNFEAADKIKEQLLREHGVRVMDRESIWRSGCSESGSGSKFGRQNETRGRDPMASRSDSRRTTPDREFGPKGHDYRRVGARVEKESEIDAALAERLQCKLNRNFRRADEIQFNLMTRSVFINDGTKEWRGDGKAFDVTSDTPSRNGTKERRSDGRASETRADNPSRNGRAVQPFAPSPPRSYSQSPHGEYSEDLPRIEELVAQRAEAKAVGDFRRADAIREELRLDYNVIFNDRLLLWSVGGDFGLTRNAPKEWRQSPTSHSISDHDANEVKRMLEERTEARLVRNFKEADAIREHLRNKFNVLVSDRTSEWWVEWPQLDESRGGASGNDQYELPVDEVLDIDESSFANEIEPNDAESYGNTAESSELQRLTVAALRERLREAGLPVSGKKSELIARLTSST
jgi:cysteinyl-tRNA synthetase